MEQKITQQNRLEQIRTDQNRLEQIRTEHNHLFKYVLYKLYYDIVEK